MKTRILTTFSIAAILALGVIACGDDDDDDGANGAAGGISPAAGVSPIAPSTVTTTPTDDAPPEATGGATVTATDFAFDPRIVQIQRNAEVTIRLKNDGTVPHTMTVYEAGDFGVQVDGADTGRVAPGETGEFKIRLPQATEWVFRCEVHPEQMRGELINK